MNNWIIIFCVTVGSISLKMNRKIFYKFPVADCELVHCWYFSIKVCNLLRGQDISSLKNIFFVDFNNILLKYYWRKIKFFIEVCNYYLVNLEFGLRYLFMFYKELKILKKNLNISLQKYELYLANYFYFWLVRSPNSRVKSPNNRVKHRTA